MLIGIITEFIVGWDGHKLGIIFELMSIPNWEAYVCAAGKADATNWIPWFVIIFPNLANPLGFWLSGKEAFTVLDKDLISITPVGLGIVLEVLAASTSFLAFNASF